MKKKLPAETFTVQYNGRANVLTTAVQIGSAFDHLKVPGPPSLHQFTAIWDTGATNTVITSKVAEACGLKPISITRTETAGGTRMSNVYLACVLLPNKVMIDTLRVSEAVLNGDADVLIGMDVIGAGDFAVTNFSGNTTFSFRIPSMERIDFVKENRKIKMTTGKKGRRQKKKQKRRR